MLSAMKKIYLLFLFYSILAASEEMASDSNEAGLRNMIDHANLLVRQNKFRTAFYIYKNIFSIIDSVETSGTDYPDDFDSLRYAAGNHYANLEALVPLLKINYEKDLFCFTLDDFDLNDIDSQKIEYEPFPDKELKSVRKWIDKYTKNSGKTFQIYLNRSGEYIEEVRRIFSYFGLPEELAFVPMTESGYSPFAHSFAKAAGLWQFIPSTGKIFGLESNWWEDDRKNVIKSTIAAARFYKFLYKEFGDWNLVLAAYNCGPGNVNKAIKKHNTRNFWSLSSLPKETREYVPRLRALVTLAKDPVKYGFVAEKQQAYHDTVMLDSCISLNVVSISAGISYEMIKQLNPHLRQWCLPPYAKNYSVMIPAGSKILFRQKLNTFTTEQKYPVLEYTAEKNESEISIAKKFKVDKSAVRDLNPPGITIIEGSTVKIMPAPLESRWFTDFNNRYLSFYDEEEYYLDGRKKMSYRVKKGDSIWAISKKFNVNSNKLKSWNNIGKNNVIKPGQNLVIYL